MIKLHIKVLWPGVSPGVSHYNEVLLKSKASVTKYYNALRKQGYSPELYEDGKDKDGVEVFRIEYPPSDWAKMVIEEIEREQGG